MSTAAPSAKSCCAEAYASGAARYLLGDTFHPGGEALTDELARAQSTRVGGVVVDLASGPGSSALRVSRSMGCTVIAVDIARPRGGTEPDHDGDGRGGAPVRSVCGDAEAIPLRDASADGVLCECAFCLFPDKPAAAREIARVLRPGARLALSDVWVDPSRLPPELRALDAYVACVAEALPLARTAEVLAGAGLTIERVERRDEVVAPLLDRIGARLRLARLIGGGPLVGLQGRAEPLLRVAQEALRDGALGYGVVIARRPPPSRGAGVM